jgi:hypothetical protein
MDAQSELAKLMQMFQKEIAMPPDKYDPNSLDSCIAKIESNIERILEFQKSLIPRVDALERFRWHLMGAIASVTIFVNVVWEWIKTHAK